MKILMAIDSLSKGGTERRMLELIKDMCINHPAYEILLISLSDEVTYEYVYQLPIQFQIIKRRYKKDFTIWAQIIKAVRKFKPDIIHSWGSLCSVFLAPVAKMINVPFVNGFIGRAPSHLSSSDKHYLRGKFTFPFSDAIISNSKAGLKMYKVPPQKAYCIYNGIDLRRFKDLKSPMDVRKEIFGDYQEGSFIVAMVAAFQDRKDHSSFISAAINLAEQDMAYKFLLIGDGKNMEAIRSSTPKQLVGKNIFFLGARSDVESILQIVDVGVLLTNCKIHGEGIANSIIEYMASGKPVIATKGGGTNELIQHGVNGLLVNCFDVKGISDAITTLRKQKELACKLSKNGLEFIHTKFDINQMTNQYLSLYNKLLKSH